MAYGLKASSCHPLSKTDTHGLNMMRVGDRETHQVCFPRKCQFIGVQATVLVCELTVQHIR